MQIHVPISIHKQVHVDVHVHLQYMDTGSGKCTSVFSCAYAYACKL